MEYLPLIITVSIINILDTISPGPGFIAVVKNTLLYSKKAGFLTGLGIALGDLVHITYCLLGIASIISQSILVFSIIKLLGAGYLIYIGMKSIFIKTSKIESDSIKKKANISSFEVIKIGFLTTLLNPKATLFFLSLFTIVISPETPNLILAILSFIIIINTVLWFSLVAIFFTQKRIRNAFDKFQGIFNKVLGGLLISLGVKVALTQK